MIMIEQLGLQLYLYCLDFCVNTCNLLGIDYITFGSLFFGGLMNGVILILIIWNVILKNKH